MGHERLVRAVVFGLGLVGVFLRADVCALVDALRFDCAPLVTLGLPAFTEGAEARFLALLLPLFFFDELNKPILKCQ